MAGRAEGWGGVQGGGVDESIRGERAPEDDRPGQVGGREVECPETVEGVPVERPAGRGDETDRVLGGEAGVNESDPRREREPASSRG